MREAECVTSVGKFPIPPRIFRLCADHGFCIPFIEYIVSITAQLTDQRYATFHMLQHVQSRLNVQLRKICIVQLFSGNFSVYENVVIRV